MDNTYMVNQLMDNTYMVNHLYGPYLYGKPPLRSILILLTTLTDTTTWLTNIIDHIYTTL